MNEQTTNQQNGQPMPNWNSPVMTPPWWTNPWMFYNGMGFQNQKMINGVSPGGNNNQTVMPQTNDQNNKPPTPSTENEQKPNKSISCVVVSSEGDIKPADVPMNGGFGMFMQNDLSAIYIKQWQSDGKIYTKKFVQSEEPEPIETGINNDVMNQLNSRFEKIENSLYDLAQAISGNSSQKSSSLKKKEVLKDE